MLLDDEDLLVEITRYTAAATFEVLRYSMRGYTTLPTDTPADTLYDPVVLPPLVYEKMLFDEGRSGVRADPRAKVSVGFVTLDNADGSLDATFNVANGSVRYRSIKIYKIKLGAAYSTASLRVSGYVSQAAPNQLTITVGFKDGLYLLATPHTVNEYAGNNVLPAGVEGTADIGGKKKIRTIGKALGVEPICVNTSKLIYQVNDGAIQGIVVYDGGAVKTAGAVYTSQADMEANAPAAGQYRVWPAGGMFRLGSNPVYGITADVTAHTAGNSTVAQLMKLLMLEKAIPSGEISASDVTALDAVNSAVTGISWQDDRDTLALLDSLASTAGVGYYRDVTNVIRLRRFDGTMGTPFMDITTANCKEILGTQNDEDVPTLKITLRYAQYGAAKAINDIDPALTQAQIADLKQQWRSYTATTTISPNPHFKTQEATRDTCYTTLADTTTEATRLLAITDSPNRTHKCMQVDFDYNASGVSELSLLDVNATVNIISDRFDFNNDTGTLRLVLGYKVDLVTELGDLIVWGP